MAYRPRPPRLYAPRPLRNVATPNPFHQIPQAPPTNPFHQIPGGAGPPNPFQQIPQAPNPFQLQQTPIAGGMQRSQQAPMPMQAGLQSVLQGYIPPPDMPAGTIRDHNPFDANGAPGAAGPRSDVSALRQQQQAIFSNDWKNRIAQMAHHLAPGDTLERARHQLQHFTVANDGVGPAEHALSMHYRNITDAHTAASRLARMLGQTRIAPGMRRGTARNSGVPNGYSMVNSGTSSGYGQQGRGV